MGQGGSDGRMQYESDCEEDCTTICRLSLICECVCTASWSIQAKVQVV
jgi:hypothetical protein